MTPTLVEVLTLLAVAVGVGPVLSFLFEHFGWFQKLGAQGKWWLTLSLSVGLPLAARLALELVPPGFWQLLEPYWQSVAAGFVLWASTQVTHKLLNKRGNGCDCED